MTVLEAMEDAKEELISWDCEPTRGNLILVFEEWINNLYTYIGEDAHRHLYELFGRTGIVWEEEDARILDKIELYKKCISLLRG